MGFIRESKKESSEVKQFFMEFFTGNIYESPIWDQLPKGSARHEKIKELALNMDDGQVLLAAIDLHDRKDEAKRVALLQRLSDEGNRDAQYI